MKARGKNLNFNNSRNLLQLVDIWCIIFCSSHTQLFPRTHKSVNFFWPTTWCQHWWSLFLNAERERERERESLDQWSIGKIASVWDFIERLFAKVMHGHECTLPKKKLQFLAYDISAFTKKYQLLKVLCIQAISSKALLDLNTSWLKAPSLQTLTYNQEKQWIWDFPLDIPAKATTRSS
mgnify:CR=1 FL=1